MPEGDTIYRTATTLRPAMLGRRIDAAQLRDGMFEIDVLIGATITAIESRGKHLLMHLASDPPLSKGGARRGNPDAADIATLDVDAELNNPSPNLSPQGRGIIPTHAICSHMGMTGSWHIYRPGDPWRKPRKYAALELAINGLDVICFSPKQLELLTASQLRAHAHLRNLGPDLLAAEFDAAAVIARFRARNQAPLGEAVMDQSIVSGIGNIYKSELLFILRFDPFAPVAAFADEELAALLDKARRLLRRNSTTHRRQTRFTGEGQRMWVYSRPGEQCATCAAVIQVRRQGEAGRTTFWCPTCQPPR